MASRAAFKRLSKEYLAIEANPTPFITAKPLESNILEWHYVLRGPPDTPYSGGEYHGRLKFPSDYPYKPPAIQMITPSGRFQTNTNICMSMSNFHPSTWNPRGRIRLSYSDRKALARKSHAFNLANKLFADIFPELCTPEPAPEPSLDPVTDKLVVKPSQKALPATEARPPATPTQQRRLQQAPAAEATMPLAGNSRKWIILFVLLAYLFASKAVSRLLNA
ncbi:ubiquitin-conjugating enzyme/RWD-like protein [Kickxella alabastrina]|uniref:ubiquitin-conjugating enzyme/RWD-like protein n=1 Tax=Kickxella alabastrina TaxID=61397 RepID=UPI002220FF6D|nr:ubiquitin-conjugating enzyme/RWD-like protein [Kickxella alabastrina]KAI7826674.1 ubiquitin-conjugating enzyme/RWD-like protein [Kickxella alabastrina]